MGGLPGNLRQKNAQAYTFDYGNRLREVQGKETYRYDAQGLRTNALDASGSRLKAFYSTSGQLLYEERRGQGTIEYVYLAGSLLATRTNGTVTYQHTDALGSPVATTNAAGQVVERTQYAPYGAAIGKTVDGIGYTGHAMDGGTGLIYMQQRYYDPAIPRFLSVDPVTPYEKPITNFNRYVYALNNPYRFTDPDGRDSVGEMIDAKAMEAAGRGEGFATYGWAFAATAWNYLGAEGVSQVADKGMDAGKGNGAMAVLEIATLGKGGTVLKAGEKIAEGAAKISIKGMTGHAVDQAINRGVKPAQIVDAIKDPLKVAEAKVDALGRQSQKIVGEKATVVVNPETGKIVTVYPTSSRTAERLLEQKK
ncbi:RHS repeat-associated core domain-containing protein [Xanthomonas vasicola]|uniref:RHS repeat-associated core domain-containing protein n=1 Tax=Xanthomonas vasicola TaxID=56459 RepID=UPI000AB12368